ncbi:hypothetical protein [Algoriphagus sp.]|uniref:hypothetical protein n=1 Tax=Algoriphagus sp. TaxID=1872435 RepID=UPI002613761F|nr:hypothetical protein [Algoriphagus sp.]
MKPIKWEYPTSTPWVIGLLLLSFLAFWQSYYLVFAVSPGYVHFHSFTAILWFALLIIQPILIKSRRLDLHRLFGKISYPIAFSIVLSILILAQSRISTSPEEMYPFQSFLLYLQLSLAVAFTLTFGFAIYFRKTKSIHARLMLATTLTFIDPIISRIIFRYFSGFEINLQWLSFGAIILLLVIFSFLDRKDQKTKWVFPGLLLLYTCIAIPIFFELTRLEAWQSFAAWYAQF